MCRQDPYSHDWGHVQHQTVTSEPWLKEPLNQVAARQFYLALSLVKHTILSDKQAIIICCILFETGYQNITLIFNSGLLSITTFDRFQILNSSWQHAYFHSISFGLFISERQLLVINIRPLKLSCHNCISIPTSILWRVTSCEVNQRTWEYHTLVGDGWMGLPKPYTSIFLWLTFTNLSIQTTVLPPSHQGRWVQGWDNQWDTQLSTECVHL